MILVTGATGFLGRYIVEELLNASANVKILVRDRSTLSMPWKGLVEIAEGNLLDPYSLDSALEGVDQVIHAAAKVAVGPKKDPMMKRINVEGTAQLVDRCLEHPIQKFVFVSSIAAIGRTGSQEIISETTKWSPSPLNSPYAISKHLAEQEVQRGVVEGLPAVIVNPGVILGAGDWQKGTPKLFTIVHNGLRFVNRGTNGYVGAKDVAHACRLVMESDLVNGERFVLVSENLSQMELFTMIARHLGKKPPATILPPFLSKLAGHGISILSKLKGKHSFINPQSVRVFIRDFTYDGTQIKSLGFQYTPIDEVIQEVAGAFKP